MPPSLPADTLAYPCFYPFGKSAGLEDEQSYPILPASHPGAATFTASLSQGRGNLAGSLPMGNVMGVCSLDSGNGIPNMVSATLTGWGLPGEEWSPL